jgi:hypothetical protein
MNENEKPMVVLGLDVSTTTIGMSLVAVYNDGTIKPVDVTHLRLNIPSKIKDAEALFKKNEMFLVKLQDYGDKYDIDKVVIEEPLISSNNSNTVSTLLKFNGIVSWSVYHILGVVPEYISSYDARKYGMPQLMAVRKYDKKGNEYPYKKVKSAIIKDELVLFGEYSFDVAKKFIIWNYISERFPNIEWIEDKKGDLKKENFDASDSLICILGYLNRRKYGEQEPKIVCCDEKDVVYDGKEKFKVFDYGVDFCGEVFNKKIQLYQGMEEKAAN